MSMPSSSRTSGAESGHGRLYSWKIARTVERPADCAELSARKRGSLVCATSTMKKPAASAKKVHASDQTSASAASYGTPRPTSGASYERVPTLTELVIA